MVFVYVYVYMYVYMHICKCIERYYTPYQVYHGHPSMRAGVLVCQKKCAKGHLDYELKESFTSSSGTVPSL